MGEQQDKIAKAIIKVMNAVKGLEKRSHVGKGQHAYDGTKDMDVKEVFNEEMAKAGLCILPTEIKADEQIDRWEEVDQWSKVTPKPMKTKQSVFTTVSTKYLLLHESGQSIELAGYGHGIDPQDKGAGKATTYALKNCLLLSFLTPVGKMPDTDLEHSNDIQTPKSNAKPVQKSKPELIPNNSIWNGVVKAIKEGFTIEQVKSKYTISEVNEAKLKEELTK